METKAIIEDYERFQIAASFDAYNSYPSLHQILEYRKHIAETILRTSDEQSLKELRELYEYTESNIKKILGIK